MRINQAFRNVADIPWERLNDNISRKLLNGNADDGPHTQILKSAPRAPDPHRGQYHLVNEEFYCLGGNFTFDGTQWFRKGSYVHYPAKCVHGARVHVKDGYLVYLRMSGTATVNFLDNPSSDSPYLLDDAPTSMSPKIHKRVSVAGKDVLVHGSTGLKSRLLQRNPETKEGTTLLSWSPDKVERAIRLRTKNELELFVVSGSFSSETGGPIKSGSYGCRIGKNVDVQLRCLSMGRVLVSHGTALQLDIV